MLPSVHESELAVLVAFDSDDVGAGGSPQPRTEKTTSMRGKATSDVRMGAPFQAAASRWARCSDRAFAKITDRPEKPTSREARRSRWIERSHLVHAMPSL